jgi:HK97 family phage major capsid protein
MATNPSPITTPDTGHAWSPDVYTYAPADVVRDALILQTSTISGDIDGDSPSLRVAFIKDDESADYVAEGATIPDHSPALDEVTVHTKKLSRLVNLSSEQFRQTQTASQVAMSVSRDIVRKADNSYLGDASNPTGLLNVAGIVDGGNVTNSLDKLVDLVAELEGNLATPSAIVLDPASWAALRKLKVGSSRYDTLLGAGTNDADARVLGLPVLRSPFVPAGTGLVIDQTAIASAVGQVRVAQSEHALFADDGVQLRSTWRIGWQVVRPERLGKFTVSAGSGK